MNNLKYFESITSTNDYLKENYKTLPNYMGAFANFQTKGRGRMGRTWLGNPGENIAFSLLVKELNQDIYIPSLTLLVATTVHKLLSEYASLTIKWPNDILYNNQKLVGILCEGVSYNNNIEAIIIGIGINVNQRLFDNELKDISTSLSLITNHQYDINKLVSKLHQSLIDDINNFIQGNKDYLNYLRNNLYAKGQLVSFTMNNQLNEGIIKDIDEDGNLVINCHDLELKVMSGEIKIIR